MQISYRVINETTLYAFYQDFSMIDTTQIINETDTSEALINLDNKIQECYDKCSPIKTRTVCGKDLSKPWISQSAKNNRRTRQKNYKLFKQRLISEQKNEPLRNLVNSQIRNSREKVLRKHLP